jgi:hypothetical protein
MASAADFDNTQAHTEGWAIFDCDGSANGRWQICALDCPEDWPDYEPSWKALDDDSKAWAHVVAQAIAGSAYHQSALAAIKQDNRAEWEAILEMHPELKPRIRVPAITRKAA